ncbi:unnamed protein product [Hyaloperonospora brassicae]|uniref:RxLR effector protein n=1 Tax=Hyaloperonospora brassicae TaxID=162125 RepID=A0AAV0TZ37_HYABA|nr:unnamed protein product [Hyaloperonospora brassicae]
MRLSSSILLISAAVLVCGSSSGASDVHHSAGARPEAETDSANRVKRLPQTYDAMDDEDRASTILATTLLTDLGIKAKGTLLSDLRGARKHQVLVDYLSSLRGRATGQVPGLAAKPAAEEGPVVLEGLKRNKKSRQARQVASKSPVELYEQELAAKKIQEATEKVAKERVAKMNFWMSAGYSPDKVLSLLRQDKGGFDVLRESDLLTMQLFITKFKTKNTGSKDTLLQVLLRGYNDDESSLAIVLSFAKEDPGDSLLARTVQTQLLQGWVEKEKSFDEVYQQMKIATNANLEKEKRLSYTIVDTMNTYIGLHNKKALSSWKTEGPTDTRFGLFNKKALSPWNVVDVFTTIRVTINDDLLLALWLSQAKTMGHNVNDLENGLYSAWLFKKKTPSSVFDELYRRLGDDEMYQIEQIVASYSNVFSK